MVNTEQERLHSFYGWFNIIFLFFIYATTIGFIFYGFAVVFPAMIKANGWGRGEAALAHTIRGLIVGFMAPLVAYSIGRLGAKRTLQIGLGIGILALSLLGTVVNQLWHWIVLWGFIMPFTFSFGGAIPIQVTVTFWFNIRRATAIGIVVTGGAVAGFIAAPLYTFLMEKTGTWRTGWLAAGVLCAMAFIIAFFMKNKPEDVGQHPDGISPENSSGISNDKKAKVAKTYRTPEPWTLKEVLRTRTAYLYLVCMVAQSWTIYILTVHGVLHLTDVGYSRMQAASVIGNLILFSGIARFPMGLLGDRIEPHRLITVAVFGMAITLVGFWKAPEHITWLLVISGIFGFCFGTTVTMFPTLIGNYFGPTAFAPITGFAMPIMIVVCAPVPFVAGLVYDRLHSYTPAFIPIITMVFIAAVCSIFMTPPKKKTATNV